MIAASTLAVLLASGCGDSFSASPPAKDLVGWVGETVTVQFRRDALGVAAELGVGPGVGVQNGSTMFLTGKLQEVGAAGITIHGPGIERSATWIPMDVILHVRLHP